MAETRMEVDSMDTALAVFGSCDENIRLLEQALGVTVVCRGTELKFSGPEEAVQKARRAVDAMLSLREGGTPAGGAGGSLLHLAGGRGRRRKGAGAWRRLHRHYGKGPPGAPENLGAEAVCRGHFEKRRHIRRGTRGTARRTLPWPWR